MNLKKYLSARGQQASITRKIVAQQSDICNWKNRKKKIPIHFCVKIERATDGQVTRKDLRPDDWHLIWPELSEKDDK